jgi:hypothetical protein
MSKTPRTDANPAGSLRTFLEQAAAGCISGRVSEWPQLVPACKWAVEYIGQLEHQRDAAAEAKREGVVAVRAAILGAVVIFLWFWIVMS